uniref:C2H2-type domain-containing protein n=1 Tax=Eptatretus burgeri TaxID=7764 RepID=A0A8C4QEQ0_EPTBU
MQCSTCSQAFSHSSNLSKHKKIHTGVKPFKCSTCSKAFSHSSNLSKQKKCIQV